MLLPLDTGPSMGDRFVEDRTSATGRWTKPLYKDFPRCQAGVLCFSFAKQAVGLAGSSRGRVALKLQCDREQTAHLQTVLLHLSVRTQIRTAQPGSIRATWLGTIAAAYGLSSSPAAGLTCQCIFESTSWVEETDLVVELIGCCGLWWYSGRAGG